MISNLKYTFLKFLFYIFRIFPIKKNKIVISCYYGKGFGDNPKYICEEILKFKFNFDIVWIVENEEELSSLPLKIRGVNKKSLRTIYELVTAKIWIDNSRKMFYVRKRKKQYYIQTWHGGIPLKQIEFDAFEKLSNVYVKNMINDNKMIDLFLSNSNFSNNLINCSFKYSGKILCVGNPRNDILINNINKLKNNAKNNLNICDEKIILYVPTFRNSYESNPYDLDYNNIIEKLNYNNNDNWKILVKLHPNVKNPCDYIIESENVINVSSYQDTQELEALADFIITDYSSLMFEGLEINKPVILYIKDYESYINNDRNLYFSFDNLPFEKAFNSNDIINFILNFDYEKMNKNYLEFIKNIGLNETGKSSELVSNIIIDNIFNIK